MRIKVWLSILLCISMLAGCSFSADGPLRLSRRTDGNSLGLAPDFSYTYEEQTPNILLNQIGYQPDGSKVALFQGKQLDSSYVIYNADSGNIVFTGTLREAPIAGNAEEEKDYLYLADFSQLTREGRFYLFHKNLGYSDEFFIKEDPYEQLESHLLKQLALENRDTASLCYQLAGLLLTLELYSGQIQDVEEVHRILQEKIELLGRAQDEETGSVYEVIPEAQNLHTKSGQTEGETSSAQPISLAATAEYAGVMAMYACYIQNTDRQLAKQCQMRAEKAFASIAGSLDNVSFDAGYFAVSQLYKKTLRPTYAQAIGQYLAMQEEQKSYTVYDFTLFGDYAYLTGKQGINLEWSRQLMNKVMKQAEEISLTAGRENYYVSNKRELYDVEGMLQDTSVMALVNYVITNHEYSSLLGNYLDYFLGRNPQARCLVEGFGARNMPEGQEESVGKSHMALLYLLLQSRK